MSSRHFVAFALCVLLSPIALASAPCQSAADCNEQGGAAYRQQRYAQAIELYEWQLRYAEQRQDEGRVDAERALNNLMLANLKAGHVAKARAWMWVALQRDFDGKATQFNAGKVTQAFDYNRRPGLAGHYARYAGMGEWATLDIERNAQGGYLANFSLLRIGNPATLMDYGPAAIGELSGRLSGDGAYFRVDSADLEKGCNLQLLHEGIDIVVVEAFREGCQTYGGMGIHAAGTWRKLSQ